MKGLMEDFVPKDMVDLLLQLADDPNLEVKLNYDSVMGFTQELDRVIGRKRWVEEKDIPQLPYIDAIMKETMRKHPVAVLLPLHLAQEDCNVAGYHIRKGTRVFINSWSIDRDSSFWGELEEFRPEIFLQGKVNIMDVKGQSF
ncbi:hypothetical protein LWI29_024234 [Acer saccharum]|uniref:Cytochrome P450 n=1 Tax=Acer saccharum TaxID=4024 RepID=A0AA39VJ66_ACESA|nr:hypothetical protein LWI29_024234 [Acer saccharum]